MGRGLPDTNIIIRTPQTGTFNYFPGTATSNHLQNIYDTYAGYLSDEQRTELKKYFPIK